MSTAKQKHPLPKSEIRFSFARSSKPGGQNVNKVNSKAILKWNVVGSTYISNEHKSRFLSAFATRISKEGVLTLASQRSRDQTKNVQACEAKLQEMLTATRRPPRKRKPTKPSKTSIENRLKTKRHRAKLKSHRRVNFDD